MNNAIKQTENGFEVIYPDFEVICPDVVENDIKYLESKLKDASPTEKRKLNKQIELMRDSIMIYKIEHQR